MSRPNASVTVQSLAWLKRNVVQCFAKVGEQRLHLNRKDAATARREQWLDSLRHSLEHSRRLVNALTRHGLKPAEADLLRRQIDSAAARIGELRRALTLEPLRHETIELWATARHAVQPRPDPVP